MITKQEPSGIQFQWNGHTEDMVAFEASGGVELSGGEGGGGGGAHASAFKFNWMIMDERALMRQAVVMKQWN